MHEASIAMSIVETVLSEAEKQNAAAVNSVEIELGELTFLGADQIEFWVSTNFENTIAAGAKIRFKTVRAEIRCEECGFTGGLPVKNDPAYHLNLPVFACPACGRSNITITRGKDALIRRIEIEKE